MSKKHSFAPVINQHTRLLILGSLPGEKSLAQNQYYGNRQNRFWTLMSEVTQVDLVALEYPARLNSLLENGIGLWDVVAEAHRDGSLDSNIRDQTNNDLPGLISTLPQLRSIAFNGGTAARLGMKVLKEHAERFNFIRLPSSSPAHTIPYVQKLEAWSCLRTIIRNDSNVVVPTKAC